MYVKKNNGFTLIELLAVLVLLALIMAISFPNFTNLTNNAKANYERSTQVLLKSAAKMYVNNNPEVIGEGNNVCIQVGKLVALEYLDSELKTSDGTPIPMDQCVRLNKTVVDGKTKYTYSITVNDTQSGDYYPPLITMRKAADSTSNIMCSKLITLTERKTSMSEYIAEYDNNCEVLVTDNSMNDAVKFNKLMEDDIYTKLEGGNIVVKLEKVVTLENNKIFIKYNASDGAGNKAIPLNVQIVLPE